MCLGSLVLAIYMVVCIRQEATYIYTIYLEDDSPFRKWVILTTEIQWFVICLFLLALCIAINPYLRQHTVNCSLASAAQIKEKKIECQVFLISLCAVSSVIYWLVTNLHLVLPLLGILPVIVMFISCPVSVDEVYLC